MPGEELRNTTICQLHASLEEGIKGQLSLTNEKLDKLENSIHQYQLELVKHYVPKKEFERRMDKVENAIAGKKDRNGLPMVHQYNGSEFKEKVILHLLDFGKFLIYAVIILAGVKATGLF